LTCFSRRPITRRGSSSVAPRNVYGVLFAAMARNGHGLH
jgi:hypothetical protein